MTTLELAHADPVNVQRLARWLGLNPWDTAAMSHVDFVALVAFACTIGPL